MSTIHESIHRNLDQLRKVCRIYETLDELSDMKNTLETIISNVETLATQHNRFAQWQEEQRQFYVDRLSYDEVKELNIEKTQLAQLFIDHRT